MITKREVQEYIGRGDFRDYPKITGDFTKLVLSARKQNPPMLKYIPFLQVKDINGGGYDSSDRTRLEGTIYIGTDIEKDKPAVRRYIISHELGHAEDGKIKAQLYRLVGMVIAAASVIMYSSIEALPQSFFIKLAVAVAPIVMMRHRLEFSADRHVAKIAGKEECIEGIKAVGENLRAEKEGAADTRNSLCAYAANSSNPAFKRCLATLCAMFVDLFVAVFQAYAFTKNPPPSWRLKMLEESKHHTAMERM